MTMKNLIIIFALILFAGNAEAVDINRGYNLPGFEFFSTSEENSASDSVDNALNRPAYVYYSEYLQRMPVIIRGLINEMPTTAPREHRYVNTEENDEAEEGEELLLYPNPASNFFTLSVYTDVPATYLVNIIDRWGTIIITQSEQIPPGNHDIFIRTEDVPSGTYTVRTRKDGKIYTNIVSVIK